MSNSWDRPRVCLDIGHMSEEVGMSEPASTRSFKVQPTDTSTLPGLRDGTGSLLNMVMSNQPPPLEPYNLFTTDTVLSEAVSREGGETERDQLVDFGERVGTEEVFRWGDEANRYPPVLRTHDRFGERIDEVDYHPGYHALMEVSVSEGIHFGRFGKPPGEGAYVTRNARAYLTAQVESGHGCPVSMTSSVLSSLRHQPDLSEWWEPRILSRTYDPRSIPPADKQGLLLGMGMTERQGGSDVRANISTARPSNGGGPGAEYRLSGHKWFTSAPMCDAFLILAQAPGGLSCFLVPRILADGARNGLRFQRLKDKLGNRSNASSEVEFDNIGGWLVGEEGRGVPTIIEMVNGTRVDCVVWSAGLMRQAVAQAGWHVAHRTAFGSKLIDKPLMQNVMADLELETEAATLMMTRLSGAHDAAPLDEFQFAFIRLATPVAKYWVTKRCSPVVREALECVGGNGYVEESILPRLYRESPLNAIWEGAGNVIALDVLRAIQRSPESVDAFFEELSLAGGSEPVLDQEIEDLRKAVADAGSEADARRLIERLAVAWASSLLVRYGDQQVSDAYLASRIGGDWGAMFGTLPETDSLGFIARRAVPAK